MRNFLLFTFCFFLSFAAACSIPNLEAPECTAARQTIKEFYSLHFGNDMRFTPENLGQRKRFLTAEFTNELLILPVSPSGRDPFTITDDDLPRAFRVGGCRVTETNKRVDFGVLLFWRTDTRTEERQINVEAVKQNDKWLIDKISENNQK
jgi:hypothetical protein